MSTPPTRIVIEPCGARGCPLLVAEGRAVERELGSDCGAAVYCECHGRAYCSPRCRDTAHARTREATD